MDLPGDAAWVSDERGALAHDLSAEQQQILIDTGGSPVNARVRAPHGLACNECVWDLPAHGARVPMVARAVGYSNPFGGSPTIAFQHVP